MIFVLLMLMLFITGCAPKPTVAAQGMDGVQTVKVTVKGGYQPQNIVAKAGQPLRLEFFRDEDPGAHSCGEEVEIPSQAIKVPLPARESRIIELKPVQAGDVEFRCGMNMLHGKITFK